jgi:hypothetical protein
MSAHLGTGSGTSQEATLTAMLQWLDAIEAKLEPLAPLQARVATIEEALQTHEQQHQDLSATVTRLEMTQHDLRAEHQQPDRRRPSADDDVVPGSNVVPTAHKLEFPKFDGNGDPLPWLNRCEHYFHVHRTPDHQRVPFAAFYLLDDVQLWFHRMVLNGSQLTWEQFVKLVNTRFRPPLTNSPLGELTMLWHTGTVDEYITRFMALSCHDPTLLKAQQVQLYITDLGDPLRTDDALQQLATLDDAVIFTRAYEQRNASRETAMQQPCPSGRAFPRPAS